MTTKWRMSGGWVRNWTVTAAVLAGLTFWAIDAPKAQTNASQLEEAAEEAREAANGLARVMSSPETSIPPGVLERAKAIGVFANVVQAAFIAGGRGGDGVISARTNGAWTVPAFFRMGGASVGLQIGGRQTDIVLVFTTQKALDALLDDRLEFGAEVKAVAGPNAAEAASAATTIRDAGLLIYAKDRGLFAGAALDGAIITPHNDLNRALYGVTAVEILRGTAPKSTPAAVQPFLEALRKHLKDRS
jgi:lipid-binding SYLF domain-containing protein